MERHRVPADLMSFQGAPWLERDERVEIIDRSTEDHGVLKLHSFYVRFLLPMMVEVQCFEWQE